METKALYLVACFDDATQELLAGYYDALVFQGFAGTQTKEYPYHLTLGSAPVEEEERLVRLAEEAASSTGRIPIRLSHFGLFGLRVLFLGANPSRALIGLRERLFGCCGEHDWCPHATILIDEPAVILQALPVLEERMEPISAKLVSLRLSEFFPHRLVGDFPLR